MKKIIIGSLVIVFINVSVGASSASFLPANRPYDALNYKIALKIDPPAEPKDFDAVTTVKLKMTRPEPTVTFDTEKLKIKSVTLLSPSKRKLAFKSGEKLLEVTLPKGTKAGRELTIAINYSGTLGENTGFFMVHDPDEPNRGAQYFTMFEAFGARTFYPCNDEPYDKATTEVEVTVPNKFYVISNGKMVSDRKVATGWHEVHWRLDKPNSTYLVSIAIGQFVKVTDSNKSPEVSIWVGRDKAQKAVYTALATRRALDFFETYLGVPYPWNKYATIGIPTYLWGGMENTSATHMNQERMILDDPSAEREKSGILGLVAHELAHQWFGDAVTMKWWTDVWLNESFASYMATKAVENIFSKDEANLGLVSDTWLTYFRMEDGPLSHPIEDATLSELDNSFDAINYTKGENVLRTLSTYLGEAKFQQGLGNYVKKYLYSNADYKDFFAEMAETAGENLDAFRDSWMLQRGYPVVKYNGEWSDKNYKLTLTQHSNHEEDKSLFVFRMPVSFHRKTSPAYDETVLVDMKDATKTETVTLPAEPEWVSVNPGGMVLAKVVPLKSNEDTLVLQAKSDLDSTVRMWAAYQLLNGLAEGHDISGTAEKAVISVLEQDPSPYVRSMVLNDLEQAKVRWLPEKLGEAILNLHTKIAEETFTGDLHGWTIFRAELLSSLGKVKGDTTFAYLSKVIMDPNLPIEDLTHAARGIAMLGNEKSDDTLKAALKLHEDRGYRYRYEIAYAFGSLENPVAAKEIRGLAQNYGSDLLGRIGWVIQDNQTLKNSNEWTAFLEDFVLNNGRFGDEVKSRVLHTIEEVKTASVKQMLESINQKTHSDRIRELTKKILTKNFET
jgi:aminopeptidase N